MGIKGIILEKRRSLLCAKLGRVTEEWDNVSLKIYFMEKDSTPLQCMGWPCSKCHTTTCGCHSRSADLWNLRQEQAQLKRKMNFIKKRLQQR